MAADVAILAAQVQNTPAGYTIPGGTELLLKAVRATYNGASAAGSFVPVLQIVAPGAGGTIVFECPLGQTLAAGVSADVSWFPGVSGAVSTTAGIKFATEPQSGTWLDIETTGSDHLTQGMSFSNANGIFFTCPAPASNPNGTIYVDAEISSGAGNATGEINLTTADSGSATGVTSTVSSNSGNATGYNLSYSGASATLTSVGVSCAGGGSGGTASLSFDGVDQNSGTGTSFGGRFHASNTSTGKEIAIQGQTAGHQAGASSCAIQCLNHAGAAIFQVRDDGTVHILTGGVIHADL